jgi:hypothetical protein
MSKVGVEIQIDVNKIDEDRLYKGKKGNYLTMTAFIDLHEIDQYGNNGMVTHKKGKDEERAPILGNTKVFWASDWEVPKNSQQMGTQVDNAPSFEDDIPFN